LPPIRAAVSAAFSSDLAMEVCAPIRKNPDSTKQAKSFTDPQSCLPSRDRVYRAAPVGSGFPAA
jgi:hypothetical protein